MAPQGRMRGNFATVTHLRAATEHPPLISQRAGPLTASASAPRAAASSGCAPTRACGRSPKGEAQTVEKDVLTPWPPLRGGSARRRWGRELCGCPKYFGLWQGSLPPPLRGTSLAEGGQRVKKHRLCYIENVGATIGRPPAWRSNALSGMAFLQGIRARASNARPYKSFSTV